MLILLFTVCSASLSKSFLQQDKAPVDISAESQPDYDLFTYKELETQETKPYSLTNFYPQGESSPENDFLLVQYQIEIDYIYNTTYLVQVTNTSTPPIF